MSMIGWLIHLVSGRLVSAPVAEILPPIRPWIGDKFTDWNGVCPDCSSKQFYEGPHGGICVNIQCVECGTRLNTVQMGNTLMAQRI